MRLSKISHTFLFKYYLFRKPKVCGFFAFYPLVSHILANVL